MALTNSYIDVAEADQYFLTRIGASSWASASLADKQAALITASGFIDDEYSFVGVPVGVMSWPRKDGQYFDKKSNTLVILDGVTVPAAVKKAVMEQAFHLLVYQEALSDPGVVYDRIKVGPIEIEDSTASASQAPVSQKAKLLNKLLSSFVLEGSSNRTWWRVN